MRILAQRQGESRRVSHRRVPMLPFLSDQTPLQNPFRGTRLPRKGVRP